MKVRSCFSQVRLPFANSKTTSLPPRGNWKTNEATGRAYKWQRPSNLLAALCAFDKVQPIYYMYDYLFMYYFGFFPRSFSVPWSPPPLQWAREDAATFTHVLPGLKLQHSSPNPSTDAVASTRSPGATRPQKRLLGLPPHTQPRTHNMHTCTESQRAF